MKKFFNDHLGLFFVLALIVAVAALVLSLSAKKENKSQSAVLDKYGKQLDKLGAPDIVDDPVASEESSANV